MTPKVALVTGATQGLGLALVEGLAARLSAEDTVYLTGRDAGRVAQAVEALPAGGARVRGEVLDVADPHEADRLVLGEAGIRFRQRPLPLRRTWSKEGGRGSP